MHVAWMISWNMKVHAKPLGLSTWSKPRHTIGYFWDILRPVVNNLTWINLGIIHVRCNSLMPHSSLIEFAYLVMLLSHNSPSRRSSYYGDYSHYGPRYSRRWPGYGAGASSWFGSNNSWSSGWTSGSSYRGNPSLRAPGPPQVRLVLLQSNTGMILYRIAKNTQNGFCLIPA